MWYVRHEKYDLLRCLNTLSEVGVTGDNIKIVEGHGCSHIYYFHTEEITVVYAWDKPKSDN
jgi:hypothetical protein